MDEKKSIQEVSIFSLYTQEKTIFHTDDKDRKT